MRTCVLIVIIWKLLLKIDKKMWKISKNTYLKKYMKEEKPILGKEYRPPPFQLGWVVVSLGRWRVLALLVFHHLAKIPTYNKLHK